MYQEWLKKYKELRKRKEYKNYKYTITFKNKEKAEGNIKARNMKDIYNILFKNSYFISNNNKRAIYFNREEIQTLYVIEEEKMK